MVSRVVSKQVLSSKGIGPTQKFAQQGLRSWSAVDDLELTERHHKKGVFVTDAQVSQICAFGSTESIGRDVHVEERCARSEKSRVGSVRSISCSSTLTNEKSAVRENTACRSRNKDSHATAVESNVQKEPLRSMLE